MRPMTVRCCHRCCHGVSPTRATRLRLAACTRHRQAATSTSKSPRPCVPCDHNSAAMPSEQVLRWAAGVVGGTRVRSAENLSRSDHRPCGTFRLRIDGPAARATDVILKVPVPRWILDGMVITNASALRLAETHGLAAPRLIAADLDGRASGTVTTLETFLSGSSDLPPMASAARLREAGASVARVNAVVLESQADLPYRPRPIAVDDRATDRRRGWMPATPP